MNLLSRVFVNLQVAAWEEAKGKLISWLALSDITNGDFDEEDVDFYKHLERCVMVFIEAIENNKELRIVEDEEIDVEDNYHGC